MTQNKYLSEPRQQLHTSLIALDRVAHARLKVRSSIEQDYSPAAGMNSLFLNAVEFTEACAEYPIVFVRVGTGSSDAQAGQDAAAQDAAPMAVLGLQHGENLYLEDKAWSARYVPAQLRCHPFQLARTAEDSYTVCLDSSWSGFSETEGQPLFNDQGEATELLGHVQQFLEQMEGEVQRTRAFCRVLLEKGLLQDMRFDATLPDGEAVKVDGFMAINQEKLAQLPDADVLEMHRNGMLMLIHAHIISMPLMRRLLEKRLTAA